MEELFVLCAVWVKRDPKWSFFFHFGYLIFILLFLECLSGLQCTLFILNGSRYIIGDLHLQVEHEVVLKWFFSSFSVLVVWLCFVFVSVLLRFNSKFSFKKFLMIKLNIANNSCCTKWVWIFTIMMISWWPNLLPKKMIQRWPDRAVMKLIKKWK